jgi:hypothetical protein
MAAATMASTAFPFCWNISIAAMEASGWDVATKFLPMTGERAELYGAVKSN